MSKNTSDWRPRISVVISEEQFFDLQKHIPWGMSNKLFRGFADEIIRISKEQTPTALALLVKRGFTVTLKE